MPRQAALADLLERDWTAQAVGSAAKPGVARQLGWRCYHVLRSKGSDPGFPDWTLARDRLLFLELKREAGRVSDAQREWGRALVRAGGEFYVVRPRHLDALGAVLALRSRPTSAHSCHVAELVADTLADLGMAA